MSRLVVMGRDNPTIQEKINEYRAIGTNAMEQIEFLKKRAEKIAKDTQEKQQAVWREIEAEIDNQGYLKDGKKAKEVLMEIDLDTDAVLKVATCKECGGNHGPIKNLLKGLFDRL